MLSRNTYRSLRKVEAFLGLPCFDYSQAAYLSDRDHPPTRRPRTIHERVHHYHKSIANLFGLLGSSDDDHISHGDKLFKDSPKKFQSWITDTFRSHNQALLQLLDKEAIKVDIKQAKWSL